MQRSSEHGRKGFRCVGDMNPFFDNGMTEEAIKYEGRLERNFDLPLIGVCAYTKDKLHSLEGAIIELLYQRHNRIIGATNKN